MKYLVCLLFLFLSIRVSAQGVTLSDQAEISVLTCGPYQGELYSAFGHSAFRVYDPQHGIDDVYNYGIFDFDQPNFYLNFARGFLYYKLGVQYYPRFREYYIYFNRYIHEQQLNFTPAQKQALYDYLEWNALPENQFYRYDYFYDNCATKIRDVVQEVFQSDVVFDGSHITTNYTIRELTDLYIKKQQPWGDLGIDICLGLPMDKKASPHEYMFLPDYVEAGFDNATIRQGDRVVPLVRNKFIVYESRDVPEDGGLPHPLLVLSIISVVILFVSARDIKRKKISKLLDVVLFSLTGLIGLLLLFLMTATDHQAAANNLNLLWALPSHVVVAIFLYRERRWIKIYFLITGSIGLLTLLVWAWLPQQLHYALIPIVIALVVRAFVNARLR